MSIMVEQGPQFVTICRRISFSSGHQYARPDRTEEQNRELFGSDYSPHGHGHNYVLEAYLRGRIDPETGMVINLKNVDNMLKKVTSPLDHRFLNKDVPYFHTVVPTTENLASYCFSQIKNLLSRTEIRVQKVRLYEGTDFWVDCCSGEQV